MLKRQCNRCGKQAEVTSGDQEVVDWRRLGEGKYATNSIDLCKTCSDLFTVFLTGEGVAPLEHAR